MLWLLLHVMKLTTKNIQNAVYCSRCRVFKKRDKMRQIIIAFFIFIILPSCKSQTEKTDYNPQAIELNNKAVEYYQIGEYDSALYYYDKAIELDRNYYLPHSNKVNIYLSRKDFKNALNESELVIEKKPDLAEGWTFTGILYDFLGDTIKAKSYYKKSIEIYDHRISNPDKKQNLESNRLNRAFSLILIGKEEEGKEEFKKLKSENPDNIMIDEFLKINKQDYIRQIIGNE